MKNEVAIEINNKLEKIFKYITSKTVTYSFNLDDLPEVNEFKTDILKAAKFDKIFEELNNKKLNCIYWFELDDNESCKNLIARLNSRRKELQDNIRNAPPENKNSDSTVLYLGIRRGGFRKKDGLTNISGRMVQHFGYYYKGTTQGLQLVHWCKGISLDIKLNIVELEGLPNDYLNVVEKLLAYHLRPMCGKH